MAQRLDGAQLSSGQMRVLEATKVLILLMEQISKLSKHEKVYSAFSYDFYSNLILLLTFRSLHQSINQQDMIKLTSGKADMLL